MENEDWWVPLYLLGITVGPWVLGVFALYEFIKWIF